MRRNEEHIGHNEMSPVGEHTRKKEDRTTKDHGERCLQNRYEHRGSQRRGDKLSDKKDENQQSATPPPEI